MRSLVRTIDHEKVDIIGDVHGEIHILHDLLRELGYEKDGRHAENRHSVFVGDLVDRGPDSPAVVSLVREWVESGRSTSLLGNHELNLLLRRARSGNEWFFGEEQPDLQGGPIPQAMLQSVTAREEMLEFFSRLPLALEGPRYRAVHACWHQNSIETLRKENDAAALFGSYDAEIEARFPPRNGSRSIRQVLAMQNENPVTVLTSGLEKEATIPFEAGGKLRRAERVRWWESYTDEVPVIFGHYWRSLQPPTPEPHGAPELFQDSRPLGPVGPKRNAWCVDYSIGRAWQVRRGRRSADEVALVALRLPELQLIQARYRA